MLEVLVAISNSNFVYTHVNVFGHSHARGLHRAKFHYAIQVADLVVRACERIEQDRRGKRSGARRKLSERERSGSGAVSRREKTGCSGSRAGAGVTEIGLSTSGNFAAPALRSHALLVADPVSDKSVPVCD